MGQGGINYDFFHLWAILPRLFSAALLVVLLSLSAIGEEKAMPPTVGEGRREVMVIHKGNGQIR